jgi:hypothetical protein
MRFAAALLTLFLLFPVLAIAQQPADVSETGKDHFEAEFPSGGHLDVHVRSGEVLVLGSDENNIRIDYSGKNSDQAPDVTVRFHRSGSNGNLRIGGGPRNEFQITIRVPKHTDLCLRMPGGELNVERLVGSKDVELHAGDMTVELGGGSEDYHHVDASVNTGGLDADPYGVSKGGLFRSFKKEGNGKFRLHAHVGAGQLTFR